MDKSVNVLITAASRRVALVRSFGDALAELGVKGSVIATDVDPLSASLAFSHKNIIVPLSTSPDYITKIKQVCEDEKVSLLIPTIDEELNLFGRYKNDFAEIGVKIPVSDEEIGEICNDKYKTYCFFRDNNLPIAHTWLPDEIRKIKPDFPLFIKPRIGRGAVNAYPVKNQKELDFFLDYVKDPVVQTYLPGDEYTVDILCDFSGEVISVVPRQRLVIRSGVCDRGRTKKDMDLINTSIHVAKTLKIIGPANLQCKVYNGKITFFEVNPRFSGAIQLTIKAGANFPRMILKMMNGGLIPVIGEFEEELTMVSYEESIYHYANGKHKPAGKKEN